MNVPANTNVKPKIDLETIHETLAYMRDDVARVPELANVANALGKAIKEIDVARCRCAKVSNQDSEFSRLAREPESILAPPSQAQFVPFTRAF